MPVTLTILLSAMLALHGPAQKPHTPAKKKPRAHRYVATAYCDKGITDSGSHTRRGIVAADPRVLPFGTVIRIDGLGRKPQTFVVTDSGSAVKGRHVDIFMPNCKAAKRFGRRYVTLRVIERPKEERGSE
jgi:3D (Asp-Asp-Asp) domain-containing protein